MIILDKTLTTQDRKEQAALLEEFMKQLKEETFHDGPGNHGSGTPQSVHGDSLLHLQESLMAYKKEPLPHRALALKNAVLDLEIKVGRDSPILEQRVAPVLAKFKRSFQNVALSRTGNAPDLEQGINELSRILSEEPVQELTWNLGARFSLCESFAEEEGVWRTINGAPVFIKTGQSLEEALGARTEPPQEGSARAERIKVLVDNMDVSKAKPTPKFKVMLAERLSRVPTSVLQKGLANIELMRIEDVQRTDAAGNTYTLVSGFMTDTGHVARGAYYPLQKRLQVSVKLGREPLDHELGHAVYAVKVQGSTEFRTLWQQASLSGELKQYASSHIRSKQTETFAALWSARQGNKDVGIKYKQGKYIRAMMEFVEKIPND